jgi:hypothetical protein
MPNQLNYPAPLDSTYYQRPSRLQDVDRALLEETNQQVLFGRSTSDLVEMWVYNPDGTFASHVNLKWDDPALTIATIIKNVGDPTEVLNIDMNNLGNRIQIQPGRYAMVANFFHDEVGSEEGYKLYVTNISQDRMELRLVPVKITDQTFRDILDFMTPSVPRIYAKGLIDQAFAHAVEGNEPRTITSAKVGAAMNSVFPDTTLRIAGSDAQAVYDGLVATVMNRTYVKALNLMAADYLNERVQAAEIELYVTNALDNVLYAMQQSGEIDPRFELR